MWTLKQNQNTGRFFAENNRTGDRCDTTWATQEEAQAWVEQAMARVAAQNAAAAARPPRKQVTPITSATHIMLTNGNDR